MSQRGLPNTLICTSVTERCLSFGLSGGHVSQTDQCFTFYNTQSDKKTYLVVDLVTFVSLVWMSKKPTTLSRKAFTQWYGYTFIEVVHLVKC